MSTRMHVDAFLVTSPWQPHISQRKQNLGILLLYLKFSRRFATSCS